MPNNSITKEYNTMHFYIPITKYRVISWLCRPICFTVLGKWEFSKMKTPKKCCCNFLNRLQVKLGIKEQSPEIAVFPEISLCLSKCCVWTFSWLSKGPSSSCCGRETWDLKMMSDTGFKSWVPFFQKKTLHYLLELSVVFYSYCLFLR